MLFKENELIKSDSEIPLGGGALNLGISSRNLESYPLLVLQRVINSTAIITPAAAQLPNALDELVRVLIADVLAL